MLNRKWLAAALAMTLIAGAFAGLTGCAKTAAEPSAAAEKPAVASARAEYLISVDELAKDTEAYVASMLVARRRTPPATSPAR